PEALGQRREPRPRGGTGGIDRTGIDDFRLRVAADEKKAPAVAAKPKNDDEDAPSRRKQQRPVERTKPAVQEVAAPRAKQTAVARPSIVSGGGGGGHSTMIGVGF
ncbi:MAG: hypothetical protein DI543_21990, partial [Bradyrhizobium icense]